MIKIALVLQIEELLSLSTDIPDDLIRYAKKVKFQHNFSF